MNISVKLVKRSRGIKYSLILRTGSTAASIIRDNIPGGQSGGTNQKDRRKCEGPKKVLHILNSLLPSGAETMLFNSSSYWDKNLERHILATKEQLGSYAEELEKAGYIIHHIYNVGYIAQHKKVREFIKGNKFDIVHIHRQEQACSYALDARLAGVKRIIRTIHNVFIFHGLVQIREYIARQVACALGVKHIAVSFSVAENERKRFHVETVIIKNWYDDNRFFYTCNEVKTAARKRLGIPENTYCIVSVGNCSPVKNHLAILRAIHSMKKECDCELLYLHVGHGEQEAEEKEYAKSNELDNKICFVGHDDPVVYLQAADLFVMPSRYEGFGIAGLEAIATGIKALFTEVPGVSDFKKAGFDNLNYCRLNDEDIAEAMKHIVRGGQAENSVKQAEAARKQFGIQTGVDLYQEVYLGGEV